MSKTQVTRHKSQDTSKIYGIFFIVFALLFTVARAYALDNTKLTFLSKQIIEIKNNDELYAAFKDLTNLYFAENKYNECVEFLKSLAVQKHSLEPVSGYFIALTRYNQLKHLEETQSWDEYFAQGNNYRDEIVQDCQKAIAAGTAADPLRLRANLLLWRFHKDQNDAFVDESLTNLMSSALEYAKDTKDISLVKDTADQLLSYGEKGKSRELYKFYVDKLVSGNIKNEELADTASSFYKQGNLELAETLYDVYIERALKATPKEKMLPVLTDIARMFAYKDEGYKDPAYAERIFQKIEELGTQEAFNEELIYLRAINLEKSKDYKAAMEIYHLLIKSFPKTVHLDEATFKIGIIHTYILRDAKIGKTYFEKLASQETVGPQAIASLYQLGILSQWENDFSKAKEYYMKLIDRAKDKYAELATATNERLKEITEGKPLDFALKSFLDASLKQENSSLDMSKLELNSSAHIINKGTPITVTSIPNVGQSGCMSVVLQFFWSGNLGNAVPSSTDSSFETAFSDEGTKIIGLVVSTATGMLDRSLDIIDVR